MGAEIRFSLFLSLLLIGPLSVKASLSSSAIEALPTIVRINMHILCKVCGIVPSTSYLFFNYYYFF